jgi:hypothetical protein
VAAGKPKMQAVGACMRKLVMVCYGVLKNRAPFDPDWASKKAACQHAIWFDLSALCRSSATCRWSSGCRTGPPRP